MKELYQKYENARNNFMHYAIRSNYQINDTFRERFRENDSVYCYNEAMKWDSVMKTIRHEIIKMGLTK